jgi:hypothetical protein
MGRRGNAGKTSRSTGRCIDIQRVCRNRRLPERRRKQLTASRRAPPASSGFREFVAFESLGARWSARGAGPDTTGARGPTEDRPGRRRKQLTGLRRRGRREPGRPGERRGGEAWTQTSASADAAGRAKAKQLTGAAYRSRPSKDRTGRGCRKPPVADAGADADWSGRRRKRFTRPSRRGSKGLDGPKRRRRLASTQP